MISAELLIQPDDQYVFFAQGPIQRADEDARVPGTNVINFNRPTLPTGTYTEASRRLVDGTPVSTAADPIAMTQVALTTREYAGPHNGVGIRPFGITEFLKSRAKHNVVALVGEFLRRDYNKFQDTAVLDLLLAAAQVVTGDGAAEGATVAAQTMDMDMLRRLNKAMKDAKIPTWQNGRWKLIINTRDEQSLKADVEYREATRHLGAANPLFHGHVASVEGFDIGVNTRFATKAVGSAGGVTGYQGVCFGPYGIGWGKSMDPQVRKASDDDYGREEKVIWVAHEAIGTLYSDLLYRTITT